MPSDVGCLGYSVKHRLRGIIYIDAEWRHLEIRPKLSTPSLLLLPETSALKYIFLSKQNMPAEMLMQGMNPRMVLSAVT